ASREPRVHFKTRGASLGLAPAGTPELVRRVERGLPYKSLEAFGAQTGLAISLIASVLGIPERTLARRKAAGKLAPNESERLLRVSFVFEKAVELFEGRVAQAVAWLTRPRRALGNENPLEYSRTELGAREVENLIGQLEHGVVS
ncbi:MAG: type II RES/Xre toxin-antitoxin system antitoxin, partial [Terriglobia bacterium]